MKNEIFRPVEFWKSACITMPDNSFYELLRSVFGKIKTPFNKQQLLNDLEAFLLREDIQKTISAYIDETDANVIAAAALFSEPVPRQLIDFFSDELSYAQMHDIIVNLEERFIFYRFTEEKTTRLALNPVLKPVLQPFTEDASALFPEARGKTFSAPQKASINDLILAGLFSFVSRQETFFKPDGSIRKKVIVEAENIFPDTDLEFIIGALQILGLFYADGDKLAVDIKYFNDFALLSPRERSEYCAAALMIYNELSPFLEILPPIYRSRIHELVNLIHSFLDFLKPESQYYGKSLERMIEVLKSRTNTEVFERLLLDSLETTGLMVNISDHKASPAEAVMKLGAIAGVSERKLKSPVITIDSGSSIIVYPEINFCDAIELASVLNIREASTVVRFELDKDAAVRAFNSNTGADEIISLLTKLSGGKTDDTLIWNLKDWEKRHREVSLKKGVILSLSQEHRYLTETKPLAALITETLAPGLYLLNENAFNDAAEALQKAGIDIIARRAYSEASGKKNRKQPIMSANKYFPPPYSSKDNFLPIAENPSKNNSALSVPQRLCEIKTGLYAILEKMRLSEQEKTELSARIERRLIICESQLKDAVIRFEKLEARHMDYSGKQNIAKQAISQQSPVEIVMSNKGKENRIFGIPQTLEKDGNELILVIDTMRIPLAKIILLRRIKKSIFEK